MVFSLFQDRRGMVWAGTQYGLANFNGVSFDHKLFYLPQPAPRDMRVNCSLDEGNETFLVGTSCGLFRLNIKTMHAEKIDCMEKLDVRSVCPIEGKQYLVCSSTGLFLFDQEKAELKSTEIKAMCYDCVAIDRDSVLICSYLGAYVYDVKAETLSKLKKLHVRSDGVLSVARDTKRSCIWLGTNGLLYKYDLASENCISIPLPFNTYKSLLVDSTGTLMCGTENGLLIYNPDTGSFHTERHKAKDYSTLTGNTVWSLMEDESKNIWVGTNNGVSVWQRNSPVSIFKWDDLTGTDDENNLFCIASDKNGNLWTGGDEGATVFSEPDAVKLLSWYRTDNPNYPLNKNTVRHITIDDEGDLWIATDGGIDLLDYTSGKFRNYIVCDEKEEASAHWVYDIADDHRGNLWIATYESGVFIVDKQSIKASPEGLFHTNRVLSAANGLLKDNRAGNVAPGQDSEMWILLTNSGLLKYDSSNDASTLFSPEFFSSPDPLRNILVLKRSIWVGTLGGLYCLDTDTHKYQYYPMPKMAYANPVAEKDGTLWAIDGESLVAVDMKSHNTKELNLGYSGFSCGTLWRRDSIVLGGKGMLAVVSTTVPEASPSQTSLFITQMRFNGIPADFHENPDYMESVVVPYGKDLEIDVSTAFFNNGFNNVEYSVSGSYSWTKMSRSFQSISFSGLRPGKHCLRFRSTDNGTVLKELNIRVMCAWYLRWYMFLVYAALSIPLIILVKLLSKTRKYLKKKQEQLDNIRRMTEADSSAVTSDKAFMEKLNEFIETNISNENLNVGLISEHLRLPSKQVYRKIKAITGFSIVEYVRNVRLKKAAALLKAGGMSISTVYLILLAALPLACTQNVISYEQQDGYELVFQTKGPTLGHTEAKILIIDGYAFKDLNANGLLDPYEDWRLSAQERAKDLASKLPIERICGLMLYSSAVDADSAQLSTKQLKYLKEDYIRHMLIRNVKDAATGAAWSNAVQTICESEPFGIPSNNSTDPRNYTNGQANTSAYAHEPDGEFDPSGSSNISKWPREVGMAATFDPAIMRRHAEIVSNEYRALGITTALSPQADLSTDPRWRRFYGTFSEDPALNRDLVREYCDAMQTTPGSKDGWGNNSVNCMVKHWPGGGTGEGGCDAHFGIGKYAVYPGNNFEAHLIPFVDGAFKLNGGTRMASAVMPYYTISTNQDPSGENVANGFSHYIIQDLLRDKYNYEGVVCTDWGIVGEYEKVYKHKGKPWGVENLSAAEKRLKCFEAGVDQLGGTSDNEISIEAYKLWAAKYGEQSARERFELSACRLLLNIFRVGNFENPYVSPEVAAQTVGCKEYVAAGYDAQLKSIVMIKNAKQVLPKSSGTKVYQPLRKVAPAINHWQKPVPGYEEYPFGNELLSQHFNISQTPENADFAIVSIKCPVGHWGYKLPEKGESDGEYLPISLQYGPYTAEFAREKSIGAGDPTEKNANRSYKGRCETTFNVHDMELVIETKRQMGDKPVIVVVATDRPFVPAEIEPYCDAILLTFGVSNNAVLDIVSGKFEPSGLLPMQLPANMKTVEEQCEDLPRDMECYEDACGNSYDFAFGLNWSGIINDWRVKLYGK